MFENEIYRSQKDSAAYLKSQPSLKFEHDPTAENKVLNIYKDLQYQEIEGFGSALTDAAAENFGKMSEKTKAAFIKACFDPKDGLGLNYCRCHINSCDFSATGYTYTEENDTSLSSFSIAHDEKWIIPMIQAAQKASNGELKLLASPWSPPAWMKDNKDMLHGGKLLPAFYSTWADYIVRYLQEYAQRGVDISAITVQNESMAVQTWESCIYTAKEQVLFVRDYLKPALKNAGLQTEIFIWDHNREHIVDWALALKEIPGGVDCVDGIAFHWYSGEHYQGLQMAHELCPDQKLFATEFCFGMHPGKPLASFDEGARYAHDMIHNFNNHMRATMDWNLILDEDGGPYHARGGGCKAPLHYDTKSDTLMFGATYYAIAHFSKFVARGARRLGTTSYSADIDIAAFLNPNGDIVAVVLNRSDKPVEDLLLRIGDMAAKTELPAHSLSTMVIHP